MHFHYWYGVYFGLNNVDTIGTYILFCEVVDKRISQSHPRQEFGIHTIEVGGNKRPITGRSINTKLRMMRWVTWSSRSLCLRVLLTISSMLFSCFT
jgi:hypothetical protein